jgi:hypothetical protein
VPAALVIALGVYACVRLPIELLTVGSVGMIPAGPGLIGMPPMEGPRPLEAFLRWDSGWYVRIIRDGYAYADCKAPGVPCPQASIAFLPGYPMAVRGVMKFGLGLPLASFLVTHLALVLALWALIELSKHKGLDEHASKRAAVAMLAFPSGIFLSAGYAEVVFLALAFWGLLFLERGQFVQAAVLLALGALTRSQGMLLVAAVAGGLLLKRDWRAFFAVSAATGLLVGAYLYWQHTTWGDALAFMHARRGWGFLGQPPLDLLREYWNRTVSGQLHLEGWLDFASIPFLAVMAIVAWRKLGPMYGAYCAALLAVPMASGQVWALSRIALCAFPAFLLLGSWSKNRYVALGLLVCGIGWLSMAGVRLANGLFVGT